MSRAGDASLTRPGIQTDVEAGGGIADRRNSVRSEAGAHVLPLRAGRLQYRHRAAEETSEGYFDVHNAPPWDTWVLLTENPHRPREAYGTCLVAWVPPSFLSLAQRGIEANPEDCICWLDDCPRDVQEIVRTSLFGTEAPQ